MEGESWSIIASKRKNDYLEPLFSVMHRFEVVYFLKFELCLPMWRSRSLLHAPLKTKLLKIALLSNIWVKYIIELKLTFLAMSYAFLEAFA